MQIILRKRGIDIEYLFIIFLAWHYVDELRAIVQEFADPSQCPQCPYSADSNEKMVKHVGKFCMKMINTLKK